MSSARSSQRDRVGAVADADGVTARRWRRRTRASKRLDFGAEHEPAARDDAIDRRADRGGVVAGTEIEKGNRRGTLTARRRAMAVVT